MVYDGLASAPLSGNEWISKIHLFIHDMFSVSIDIDTLVLLLLMPHHGYIYCCIVFASLYYQYMNIWAIQRSWSVGFTLFARCTHICQQNRMQNIIRWTLKRGDRYNRYHGSNSQSVMYCKINFDIKISHVFLVKWFVTSLKSRFLLFGNNLNSSHSRIQFNANHSECPTVCERACEHNEMFVRMEHFSVWIKGHNGNMSTHNTKSTNNEIEMLMITKKAL